jgi:predicted 3-demethylubiquinone-9 3-methyltransferase (glyoxalase superfamily)
MHAQITPFLLFNTEAEAAARFYVSVFNGKLLNIQHYPDGTPMPKDTVMTATFEILGMTLTALNWGQPANYTEAVSFAIEPETQEEVDHYWNTLIGDSGQEMPCGWLKDRYGVTWQVAPEVLPRLMNDPDPKKASAMMQAMMKMKKIIIKDLEDAYAQA